MPKTAAKIDPKTAGNGAPAKHRNTMTVDGNEAAASIAYRLSELCAIYPITPSSPMGEFADEWAAQGKPNLWGLVPQITQMQSEAGVAGAIHGMVQAGALATTFTASQGLLLMIPDMYKIAGELTPFVLHVTARTLATHALSIFGDHSDVMSVRQTGFALLASGSVQEAHDLALVAHAATLKSRVPFLHFFDGFRTSHEVQRIEFIEDAILEKMVDEEAIAAHYRRALSPDHPVLRGTAQNPDAFFQAREAINGFYDQLPSIVQKEMDRLGQLIGRSYRLFDYVGHPEAENVIVIMGSGGETVAETVDWLMARGDKVGAVIVRLYRPFSAEAFVEALPQTTRRIAVMDRTKEPGAVGEPLYQDVITALAERGVGCWRDEKLPEVVGGRYGLSSKEFTPAMVKAIYGELATGQPKRHFTVGITDDVTHLSLPWDADFDLESDSVSRSLFYGLGADGTVGANKNSIKIIGTDTDLYAQGYFVYDSKKSGAVTVSHLRFSPKPIRAPYLVRTANFVACHQWHLMDQLDVLECAAPGAVFLLNSPHGPAEVWEKLSEEVQGQILEKRLKLYVIDAYAVARETGMGGRINTIMQTCFFAISGVLPRDQAIERIKYTIEKTYARKGQHVVEQNFKAVDSTLANLHEVKVPAKVSSARHRPPPVSSAAPDFVQRVTAVMLQGKGDLLPVSAFPVDGTWPTATTRWEKRNLAQEIPVWDPAICIQCNKCVMVCPHAAIRAKFYPEEALKGAPAEFRSAAFRSKDHPGNRFTIQVAPEDCTGCELCIVVCPAKDKTNPKHKALDAHPHLPIVARERENYAFFLDKLPNPDRALLVPTDVKGSQFMEPLFEYSGACAGCGETPYVKLVSQLFGDRAIVANATGCSSIYGGNLPTTPYTVNADGRGPAWSNSLFEDNAEFGVGIRFAVDQKRDQAADLVRRHAGILGDKLVEELLSNPQKTEADIRAQRERVKALRGLAKKLPAGEALRLDALADYLVRKSVWIFGGDGWAYDIGFGGLDHVLSQGKDVNILVLDTEVYSNTGGQASKATSMGAVAKFAAAGKERQKKDLGFLAMTYGDVYVATVAFGAKDSQTTRAFAEAEAYPGTSLIIAYSHCIAHGYSLRQGLEQQKLAVESGYWPLYRFDPNRRGTGESPLVIDSAPPRIPLNKFIDNEARYRALYQTHPKRAAELAERAQKGVREHFKLLQQLAETYRGDGAAQTNGGSHA